MLNLVIYLDVKVLHKTFTFIAIVKISHLYKMKAGLLNISYKVSVVLFIKLLLNYMRLVLLATNTKTKYYSNSHLTKTKSSSRQFFWVSTLVVHIICLKTHLTCFIIFLWNYCCTNILEPISLASMTAFQRGIAFDLIKVTEGTWHLQKRGSIMHVVL